MGENLGMKIAALIVTHNPDFILFQSINKLVSVVDYIIIIDNNSYNRDVIDKLATSLSKDQLTVIYLQDNLGIGYALNRGVKYVQNLMLYDYVITLDQDTILLVNNLKDIIERANKLQQKVGAIELPQRIFDDKSEFFETESAITSGNIVNMEVYKFVKYREEFFLDQIDFDFDFELRNAGFTFVSYNVKSIDHKLGVRGNKAVFEPSYRLYYIIRNSTVLFMEGKIGFNFYYRQIRYWAVNLLREKGIFTVLKPLVVGFLHGIQKKMGKNFYFCPP